MFPTIRHINDLRPKVAHKPELRFLNQPFDIVVACYLLSDSKTFDVPETLECRGIAFDRDGSLISRPLHKFFNMGERAWLMPENLQARNDLHAIFGKIDGSLVSTAMVDGELKLRSKKAFDNTVRAANAFLNLPHNAGLLEFCAQCGFMGLTACFEFVQAQAGAEIQTVIQYEHTALTLLHVRDNLTGAYVLMDPAHPVHELLGRYNVVRAEPLPLTLDQALTNLKTMENEEGYVFQFKNGDMVKAKCDWYSRIHRAISYMRERDIAVLALNGQLDDVRAHLAVAGIDVAEVDEVERRVNTEINAWTEAVELLASLDPDLDKKAWALKHKQQPLFGLAMSKRIGQEPDVVQWYTRNKLKDDFGLRWLISEELREALAG